MSRIRIYSPSQSTTFIENPAARELRRAGWRPRYYGKKDTSAIFGHAFHVATGRYYKAGRPADETETLCNIAAASIEQEFSALKQAGMQAYTDVLEQEAALPLDVKTCVRKYIEQDQQDPIIPLDWEIGDPELSLPDYGWAKIDLPVKPPYAGWSPLDFKTKIYLKKEYKQKTLDEYAYSWQFMHYAWALSQQMGGEPTEYYVVLVALSPKFTAELYTYYIDPELMQLWEQSARTVWALMSAMDGDFRGIEEVTGCDPIMNASPLYPWHSWNWFTRWGRDEWAPAFLEAKLHDNLLRQSYVNIKEVSNRG